MGEAHPEHRGLGRERSSDTFTSPKARADHTFGPGAKDNTVTLPVTGRYADVRPGFGRNSSGHGVQVAEPEITGTAAPHPGPVVSDLARTPASPTETDAVTIRATVRDAGTAASPAADVGLEGTVAGSARVGALAAGASTTVSANAPRAVAPCPPQWASRTRPPSRTTPDDSRTATGELTVDRSPGPAPEARSPTPSAQGPDIPGVVVRGTAIHDSTCDGIRFESGGGAVPDARITGVAVDESSNGSGVLAVGGARDSATLMDVAITRPAEGDVVIEPGSPFVANRWRRPARCSVRRNRTLSGCGSATRTGPSPRSSRAGQMGGLRRTRARS